MAISAPQLIAGLDVIESGQGRPLIMLHSLLAERSVFDRVNAPLSARYRLILPNLPAYGDSVALSQPVTVEAYADRVAEMADQMQLPLETAVLGNGFGGFVAVAMAIRHGFKFGPFIFADTGAGFPDAAKEPLRALARAVESAGMEAVLDSAVKRMFPQEYIDANAGVIEERKEQLRSAKPALFAAAARALAEVSMQADLSGIENSVLVIVGAEDQTTPPALSRELRDAIPGATYFEIPGSGHCPQIQEPDCFVELVTGFLDR